jgi:hypothetical protein
VRLNRQNVIQQLGELDDLAIARIVETGASEEELSEAIVAVEREGEEGEPTGAPRTVGIAKLRAILSELAAEERDQDETVRD